MCCCCGGLGGGGADVDRLGNWLMWGRLVPCSWENVTCS